MNNISQNIFQALQFINREGLNNSQWGVYNDCSGRTIAGMFPVNWDTWHRVPCPQNFLYIWISTETAGRLLRLELHPNYTISTDDGDMVFIWELRAED